MFRNKYAQMIRQASPTVIQPGYGAPAGHVHSNPCGCQAGNGNGGPYVPLGPPAMSTVYTQGPSQVAAIPADVTMPPGNVLIAQGGATVSAQACCVAPMEPPYTCTTQWCKPLLMVECQSFTIFFVNIFNGIVSTLDKTQDNTCVFEEDTSGCCPNSGSPIVVYRNPTNPNAFIPVVIVQGVPYTFTFGAWGDGFRVLDMPLGILGQWKLLSVDPDSPAGVQIYRQKDCTPELVHELFTTTFCGSEIIQ